MNGERRLSIGTVQFGMAYGVSNRRGQPSLSTVREILETAAAAGIEAIDTAPVYGCAEQILQSALPVGHRFRIVTKTAPLGGGIESVVERARQSHAMLAQLSQAQLSQGGAPLDGLLVHSAADLVGPDGPALWRAMRGLEEDGLFRGIGFSSYLSDDLLALAERYRPDMVQLPLSLLDQRPEQDGILDRLSDLGVEIQARSVFLQGAAFLQASALPASLRHAAPWMAAFHARLAEANTHPLAAALGYVLALRQIERIVVGVTGVDELTAILAAVSEPPALDWPAYACQDPVLLDPRRW